ncbi:MAG: DUF1491 family protein [Caulobacteraceae bacterium]
MEIGSDVWVYALVRRVELAGSFATIARKGDARAGAVLVKTLDRRGREATLYEQAVHADGEPIWMRPTLSHEESDIDAYIDRAARIDPDIWVVEIEDADGARFLTERVEK